MITSGDVWMANANVFATTQTILSGADANKNLVLKANSATQTGNALEVQNSTGTVVMKALTNPSGGSTTSNFFNVTGTLPAATTSVTYAASLQITGAGSSAFQQTAMEIDLLAGYTGSSTTSGLNVSNASVATGVGILTGSRNFGISTSCTGVTTGTNIGVFGQAANGNINIGVVGTTNTAKDSVPNIGVAGFATNTGASPVYIAGYFGLQSATPTFTSAALVADNGTTAATILLLRSSGTPVFSVANSGGLTTSAPIQLSSDANGSGVTMLGRALDNKSILAFNKNDNSAIQQNISGNDSGLIISVSTGQAITFANTSNAGMFTSGGNFALINKISTYNNVATAGQGVPSIYGAGRVTAQTAANATIATYTVGAADASFIVSGNVNVTTSTAHSFTLTCIYTDETNTSRTLVMNVSQITGTMVTAITNVTGAGAYEGVPLHIRAKAGTTITLATSAGGTYTTVTYNAEGVIQQVQ